MIHKILVAAGMAAIFAVGAAAAEVDGKWTAEVPGRQGNTEMTFNFKAEGAKLTGTVANAFMGFFSGMPVTGVIVRSGVNVQSGAKTRLSSALHAVLLALAVLYLSRSIAHVPLAALAGLLCVIGYRLVEVKTFVELARRTAEG